MNQQIKRILAILLITVFALKTCDLYISYYTTFNKSYEVEKTEDESRDLSENSLDKTGKKLFSSFDYDLYHSSSVLTSDLSNHISFYSISSFNEPHRVVLTPPPNYNSNKNT